MEILTNRELQLRLMNYYFSNYRPLDTDIWFEPPAANVLVFQRENFVITLKCHILKGTVSAYKQPIAN